MRPPPPAVYKAALVTVTAGVPVVGGDKRRCMVSATKTRTVSDRHLLSWAVLTQAQCCIVFSGWPMSCSVRWWHAQLADDMPSR